MENLLKDFETVVLADRAAWKAERSRGIGSSDAPVILGLSPWKTPLQLWAEKTGAIEDSQPETQAMRMGLRLEPIVADLFAEETGRRVDDPGRNIICRHPDIPWLQCSPDRYQFFAPEERGILELKTGYSKNDWTEGPPDHYKAQVQHQLAVTGMRRASIAVLVAGREFFWADIERNDAFIDKLLEAEREFMRRIRENDPPDPTGVDLGALKALYPQDDGTEVVVDEDFENWYRRWQDAKLIVKANEQARDEAHAHMLAVVGEAGYAIIPGGPVLRFGTTHVSGREVPARYQDAYSFRTLKEIKSRG